MSGSFITAVSMRTEIFSLDTFQSDIMEIATI
jgi:hypothetical protein